MSKKRPTPLPENEDPYDTDRLGNEYMHKPKMLKRCGVVFEPQEIQEQLEIKIAQTHDEDDESSNSHLWYPCTSSKKLLSDEQHDELSTFPRQLHEDSSFPGNNSVSHKLDGKRTLRHSDGVLESVTLDIFPHQSGSQIKPDGSNHSPYPTPLKLSDEMKTPLTVYPTCLGNIQTRNNARVCTQYVYQVLDPVEQIPRDNSYFPGRSTAPFEQLGSDKSVEVRQLSPASALNGSPRLSILSHKRTQSSKRVHKGKCVTGRSPNTIARPTSDLSLGNPPLVGSSLCHLLDERALGADTVSEESFHSNIMQNADDAFCCVSPNRLDVNGIPNTTRKYKEDRKVHWHTTPFEERLRKVLYDDKVFPQRKLAEGKQIEVEIEDK